MSSLESIISNQLCKNIRFIHSRYSIERKDTLDKAKIVEYELKKDGTRSKKYKTFYTCKMCRRDRFKLSEVQVDHIDPVGAYPRFPDDYKNGYFIEWFWKLWCSPTNYQVLCKPCHKKKTIVDRKQNKINVKR